MGKQFVHVSDGQHSSRIFSSKDSLALAWWKWVRQNKLHFQNFIRKKNFNSFDLNECQCSTSCWEGGKTLPWEHIDPLHYQAIRCMLLKVPVYWEDFQAHRHLKENKDANDFQPIREIKYTTCGGLLLTIQSTKLFGKVVKHCPECLIYLFNRN